MGHGGLLSSAEIRRDAVITLLTLTAILLVLISWGRTAWWSLRIASYYPLKRQPQPVDSATRYPHVAVLLPLRGADPLLDDCLQGLCLQDYPSFEIRVILDSDEDSAWGSVRQAMSRFPKVAWHPIVLTNRLETCSLKCSALLQGIRSLDERTEIVAVIDADVAAPAWWIRELARPFSDPTVGAVSGMRWFLPTRNNCGSIVRRTWGAAASAQMFSLDVLWGGTLAYRAALLRDPELQQVWSRSFVEDTSVVAFLRRRAARVVTVPGLSMVNTETISLPGCYRFIRRQTFSVLRYHPARYQLMLTCIGLVISAVATGVIVPFALAAGHTVSAVTLLTLTLSTIALTVLPLMYIEVCLHLSSPKDRPIPGLTLMQLPMIPVTVVLYFIALFSALRMREIDWRGIHYEIQRDGSIRRRNYHPWTANPSRHNVSDSII